VSHDSDAQAELNEAHHVAALKRSVRVMSWPPPEDLVAQMLDGRHHPVDELVAHGLR
jgi:hypothetical protein